MPTGDSARNKQGLLACVLTDLQFWVPVLVLIGGLLLLRFIS